MANEPLPLVDGNRGIHIPEQFMISYWGYVTNKRDFPEKRRIFQELAGDGSEMWDMWTEIVENARLDIEGQEYRLEEHGDLFAVPVGCEIEWD